MSGFAANVHLCGPLQMARQSATQYWGHSNISDWQAGSGWEHRRTDGSGIADVAGTVLESVPPLRLVLTSDAPAPPRRAAPRR
jgi:uncharacterized protein YndB with AHSA1/START domain